MTMGPIQKTFLVLRPFGSKTRSFGWKTRRKLEVSIRKPEVLGKTFELETSVKNVFGSGNPKF
jgi:hypothetical protein